MSLVILFRTGLISQARSGALTLEEVFALKDVGEGRVGGGRKGAPEPGLGVGRGRCRSSCVRRGLVFAPSLTSNLNRGCNAALPLEDYVG